ncbi:MAG TPA: redox-regulated ATPase YchF [Nitrospirales bacterium]|nr:redox-regulated ATPase YchF [Nitrospirales bacterium]
MKVGILGYPQVGKTTLFAMLTKLEKNVGVSSSAVETLMGVAKVNDPRLSILTGMFNPKKTIPATLDLVDLGGFGKKEALRNVDVLIHVVRAFLDDAVPHANGEVDPARDIASMELELIISDLAWIEDRLAKIDRELKKMPKAGLEPEKKLLARFRTQLEAERPLRELELHDDEVKLILGYGFLSLKPMLFVLNVSEEALAQPDDDKIVAQLDSYVDKPNTQILSVCAKIEAELAQLSSEDASLFMTDLGLDEPGLDRLAREAYRLLGRISFFTVGPDEVRAWPIRQGTFAKQAAAAIHSDIERGFIRAEVVHYDDFIQHESMAACKEKGVFRLEGKEYLVREGDMINFRFNV